jgi:hypothetical protein
MDTDIWKKVTDKGSEFTDIIDGITDKSKRYGYPVESYGKIGGVHGYSEKLIDQSANSLPEIMLSES